MGMRTPGVFTPGLGSAAISAASGRRRIRILIIEGQPLRLDQSMLHRAPARQPLACFSTALLISTSRSLARAITMRANDANIRHPTSDKEAIRFASKRLAV